ncbi:MAG: AsmA family protein [Deltaproteobacteria bacterium]|nr:AsmA family protein [Deltaproteobacteria bacterium]
MERMAYDLELELSPLDPRQLAAYLGLTDLPLAGNKQALTRLAVKGNLKGDRQSLSLTNGTLELDESKLTFSCNLGDFSKPNVTFQAKLNKVELDRYLPPANSSPPAAPENKSAPPSGPGVKFDYSPLRQLTLNGDILVDQASLGNALIEGIQLKVSGDKGLFQYYFLASKAAQGEMSVKGTIDLKSDHPQVDVKLATRGIQVGALLRDAAEKPTEKPAPQTDLKAGNVIDFSFEGKLIIQESGPQYDLALDVSPFSIRELFSAWGRPQLNLADPQALTYLGLRARLKGDSRQVVIADTAVDLDETKIKMTGKVEDFPRPKVNFDLGLDRINLDRYLTPRDKSKPEPAGETIKTLPSTPNKRDYALLNSLILNGSFRLGHLTLGHARIQDARIKVSIQDGVFLLDFMSAKLYQGETSGKMTVDLRPKSPRTSLELRAKGVQAGPLIRDVLGKDELEGTAQTRMSLRSDGDEQTMMTKTLNGQGEIQLTKGAIKGINLPRLLRNIQSLGNSPDDRGSSDRTEFNSLRSVFTITNGTINTSDTKMESPEMSVNVTGKADLVNETLDFRADPKLVLPAGLSENLPFGGSVVPVKIGGKFSSPTFTPILDGLIKQKIEEGLSNLIKQRLNKQDKNDQKGENPPVNDVVKGLIKGFLGR